MKRVYFTYFLIICALFSFTGCAGFMPKEMGDTLQAIKDARRSCIENNCPDEFNEIMKQWYDALKLYNTCCYKKEAIEKMHDIQKRLKTACQDSDGDGVLDKFDKCPNTPMGVEVDENGCPIVKDSDGDGVPDDRDKCPGTPAGVKVDDNGCPLDSDGDGVPDYLDKCPNTPKGTKVNSSGCPDVVVKDSDGDGVPDEKDKCPGTPKGVKVDAFGCPLDSDGDGVPDYLDRCPNTPKCASVNEVGCWVIDDVNFDFDKWDIKSKFYQKLDDAVNCLKQYPSIKIEIQGHTDNIGTKEYNQKLSEKRANVIKEYFLKKGIAKDRMSTSGYGLTMPITTNDTEEGRAKNRRSVLMPK